jgi:hypothetical protein
VKARALQTTAYSTDAAYQLALEVKAGQSIPRIKIIAREANVIPT